MITNNPSILRIALINPPSPFLISDTVMPPLGLMYLSSYIKRNIPESEVDIIDLAVNKNINTMISNDYDIYAFTSTTPQYNITLSIMKQIKKHNTYSTFVIGGAHASCFASKCLDDGFNCVIVGEGENALTEICNFKITHKLDNVVISGSFKSKHIQNIDTIPFPDRTFEGYMNYSYVLNNKKATTMITSRGCPFKCYFCCNTWGNDVRLRSSENVLEEIKEIKNTHGINAIQFYDDTFTVDKQRVMDMCKGLKELNIIWRCFVHSSTVDFNLLRIMKESGCTEIGIGVESGNNKILKTVNKKTDINKIIKICSWCHEINLRIKTFLIIGLPGESHKTVNTTIDFLRESRPNDYDITIYTPFPLTYIWNNKEKFDIQFNKETIDYQKMFYKGMYGQYVSQISTANLTSNEIEELRDKVESLKGEICNK